VILAVTSKLTWYVARSGGLIAWACCTAAMVWGLLLSTRLVRRRGVPAWLLDLHRFLGALTIVFVLVHLLGLYLDRYTPFGLRELFIPMASRYRPAAVATGVVALYLLVAIETTSLLMKRIPRRMWRAVHATSFLLFVIATIHGFTAGTDGRNLLVVWLTFTTTCAVTFLVLVRLIAKRDARSNASVRPRPRQTRGREGRPANPAQVAFESRAPSTR
jgi:predicted ferric reductase